MFRDFKILWAMLFAGMTADAGGCFCCVYQIISRNDFPVIFRIAGHLVIKLDILGNGYLFRTMIYAITAPGAGNGGFSEDDF